MRRGHERFCRARRVGLDSAVRVVILIKIVVREFEVESLRSDVCVSA